jgi:hypothetical protein
MKKYILYILIAITPVFFSCEDFLDAVAEVDGASEAVVFNDFQSARGYFDKVYNLVDDYQIYQNQGMNAHHLTAEMSDEGVNVRKVTTNMRFLNMGLWTQGDSYAETGWNDGNIEGDQGNVIPKSFYGIRICNRILEEIPRLEHLTEDQKNQLIGQAYFFRAWFYFEVIRRVGGFVLTDRKFYADDSGNMERLTYAESTDWMIKESLDKAIKILPGEWEKSQYGRPTKSSAYALRSMAQLYAASPLMRNGIDRTDVYTDYDEDRVKLAAEYAKDCLEYLERNADQYDQRMMPGTEYKNIFYYDKTQYMSREMLWYSNNHGRNRQADIRTYWQVYAMNRNTTIQGSGNTNPTLAMINKFETENGFPCELAGSTWKCEDPVWDSNVPFAKRDPRLYYFVMLPGEKFGNIASNHVTDAQIAVSGRPAEQFADDRNVFYLATWEGGRETNAEIGGGLQGGPPQSQGRFLIKKYHWPECVRGNDLAANYNDNHFSCCFIRTTQVWLDYAEAMNEAYGPNGKPTGYQWSAVEAINMVRNRVGMPDVRNDFTADKLKFRERIRNERAVELLYECNRWFDIRRWMIAEQLFADPQPIRRARVTIKQGYTTIDNDILAPGSRAYPPGDTYAERQQAMYGACFNYVEEPTPDEVRIFERKHYWYPMRKDEVDRYPAFKQNPGW